MAETILNDIRELEKKWGDAVASGEVEAVLELYIEKAILKPTLSSSIRRGREPIRYYFEGGGPENDPGFLKRGITKVEYVQTAPRLLGDTGALDVGRYRFSFQNEDPIEADYTFVFERTLEHGFRIAAHHSSFVFHPK